MSDKRHPEEIRLTPAQMAAAIEHAKGVVARLPPWIKPRPSNAPRGVRRSQMSSNFTQHLTVAPCRPIASPEDRHIAILAHLDGRAALYFDACGDRERDLFINAAQAQPADVIAATVKLVGCGRFMLKHRAGPENAAQAQPLSVAANLMWTQLGDPARLYWLTMPASLRYASISNVANESRKCGDVNPRYTAMVRQSREVCMDIERAAEAIVAALSEYRNMAAIESAYLADDVE